MIILMACMGSMYSVQQCGGLISETSAIVYDAIGLPGQTCRYRAVLPENSTMTVRLNKISGDMDPVLTVEDDSGAVLAADDDSGGDGNALLERPTFSTPVTVVIVVSSYGANTTGDFELLVDIQSKPKQTGHPTPPLQPVSQGAPAS
jgi:hypothetical protein